MDKFEISLAVSINGVPFGTVRDLVRASFGPNYKEFKKSKFSKNTTDDYCSCHVFYSADNTLDAVEIFAGKDIIVDGYTLPTDYLELSAWVKARDPDAEEDEDGIVSKKLSIGIYAPEKTFEAILFGKAGYYNQ